MDKCWCGNTCFEEYSDQYYRCGKCNTLVAKPQIKYDPDQIDDDVDFYGKEYWESKMVNAAKVRTMDQVVDLYLHERAVYWLKSLFSYFCCSRKATKIASHLFILSTTSGVMIVFVIISILSSKINSCLYYIIASISY